MLKEKQFMLLKQRRKKMKMQKQIGKLTTVNIKRLQMKLTNIILEGRSLSEPSEEMEKVIDAGIRPFYDDIDNIRDVMYYVHNNWMENEISAEEAMRKISKFLR
jgi:hypothetical protein